MNVALLPLRNILCAQVYTLHWYSPCHVKKAFFFRCVLTPGENVDAPTDFPASSINLTGRQMKKKNIRIWVADEICDRVRPIKLGKRKRNWGGEQAASPWLLLPQQSRRHGEMCCRDCNGAPLAVFRTCPPVAAGGQKFTPRCIVVVIETWHIHCPSGRNLVISKGSNGSADRYGNRL